MITKHLIRKAVFEILENIFFISENQRVGQHDYTEFWKAVINNVFRFPDFECLTFKIKMLRMLKKWIKVRLYKT